MVTGVLQDNTCTFTNAGFMCGKTLYSFSCKYDKSKKINNMCGTINRIPKNFACSADFTHSF
ncbi:8495_t:CDS:2 [Cetraspora pellucida]|uniref:8495_t:CDS:1 n=1 Tax=Cetraspora pellucida TaxID=1433469 RepID=A0A9N8W5I4_9GLOM|nr:8495_t:CDS:2 [Cetraspora pellucida]